MRKYLVAGLIGLSLLGTQAAASEGSVLSVGDRNGSTAATSNELWASLPLFAWLYGAAFLAVIIWAADDNGGSPSSP